MTITDEQWIAIEEQLKHLVGRVTFKLGEDQILVNRQIGKDENSYGIWINGKFKGNWDKKNMPIITKIFGKKSYQKYKPSFQKQLAKMYGKKELAKRYPDLKKRIVHYVPWIKKLSVLLKQYKKIEGLELVGIGF